MAVIPLSTRRRFLQTASVAASTIALESLFRRDAMASSLSSQHGNELDVPDSSLIRSDRVKTLTLRGVDVARSSGATYADIRLTRQRARRFGFKFGPQESDDYFVGVRAFVQGRWGFASGSAWTEDDVAYLAKQATLIATAHAKIKPAYTELLPIPVVQDKHWEIPVTIDPFTVAASEIEDYLRALMLAFINTWNKFARQYRYGGGHGNPQVGLWFLRQDKAFGSTDGTYATQTTYLTEGYWGRIGDGGLNFGAGLSMDNLMTPSGGGWERFRNRSIDTDIEGMLVRFFEDSKLPVEHVDVGRYDIALEAQSMTNLTANTLGAATELDRAIGHETNSTGSSYLNDPVTMIGNFSYKSPLLTVSANRTHPGSVATVGWDDEGVAATEFTLVDKGILQRFQTTREGAAWLHAAIGGTGSPVPSTGCAHAATGADEPIAQSANLVVQPSNGTESYQSLVEGIDRGIAFEGLSSAMDFQLSGGIATGRAYTIRKGKKVNMLKGAGILFKSSDLWKNLTALGGKDSHETYGYELVAGEPIQHTYHSVTAPPAAMSEVTVIDVLRKG